MLNTGAAAAPSDQRTSGHSKQQVLERTFDSLNAGAQRSLVQTATKVFCPPSTVLGTSCNERRLSGSGRKSRTTDGVRRRAEPPTTPWAHAGLSFYGNFFGQFISSFMELLPAGYGLVAASYLAALSAVQIFFAHRAIRSHMHFKNQKNGNEGTSTS